MKHTIYFLIIFSILFYSCDKNKCDEPDYKGTDKVDFDFKRIDKEIFNFKTTEDVIGMMNANEVFARKFLIRNDNDLQLSKSILSMANDENLAFMQAQADSVFDDFDFLKTDLSKAFARIKHYYPQYPIPSVYTIISGFGNDVFAADSLIVIGIDCFLGPKAKYRPEFPNYILKNYNKENIAPGVILMLSNKYNETNFLDKSMLAEMIYWGKAYYFMEKMLPCTPDSLIIGYTAVQLKESEEHERTIWNHFLENKLLFETDHFIVGKYTGERPNITEIGNRCPGRIGRWLGWLIVRKYMGNNKEVTFQQLMAEKDTKKIFNLSGYKPQ
jgi:gliding motility-associated lipoprotein GldB